MRGVVFTACVVFPFQNKQFHYVPHPEAHYDLPPKMGTSYKAKIFFGRDHPEREEYHVDMPQCDACQRTYHWKCLTDLNACSHARQAAENSEGWHF
jgi:hypothetical protein